MSADTLCWTDIPVTNLDRAIKFYSAVLGKEVRRLSDGRMRTGNWGVGNRLVVRWESHETAPTPRKFPKRSITRAALLIHTSRGRRRNRPKKIKLSPKKVPPLRLRKLPSQNKNRTR